MTPTEPDPYDPGDDDTADWPPPADDPDEEPAHGPEAD